MQFDTYNMPNIGLRPLTIKSTVWNRKGSSVILGEVVMTDNLGTQSEVVKTVTNPGSDSFNLNNVITPTTAGVGVLSGDPGYWFGVVTGLGTLGTGADNTQVEVTWQGYVNVLITTGTTGEYGKKLYPANGATGVTTTVGVARKSVGIVLTDTTTSSAVSPCLWNGIDGFGNEAAS